MIGRELYPLLCEAGYRRRSASRRGWSMWIRASPQLVDGFTKKTFTAMIEGVRESAIKAGMVDRRYLTKESGISTGPRRRTASSATRSSRRSELIGNPDHSHGYRPLPSDFAYQNASIQSH